MLLIVFLRIQQRLFKSPVGLNGGFPITGITYHIYNSDVWLLNVHMTMFYRFLWMELSLTFVWGNVFCTDLLQICTTCRKLRKLQDHLPLWGWFCSFLPKKPSLRRYGRFYREFCNVSVFRTKFDALLVVSFWVFGGFRPLPLDFFGVF